MALTMTDVDYGRNQKGITELVNEMDDCVDNILNKINVNSSEFKNITDAISAAWVGKDADNFVTELKNKNKDVYNKIKSMKGTFTTTFQEDEKNFAKFQEGNTII